MLPILLQIGPVAIYSSLVVLSIGAIASLFVIWKRGGELRFEEETLMDTSFSIMFWSMIVSRIAYIALNYQELGFNPLRWINIVSYPGMFWFAGLLAFLVLIWQKAEVLKWDPFTLADCLVVALSLLQVFAVLANFLNGTNIGIPTSLFVGLQFPGMIDKRHPIQLYQFLLYIALFSLLWRLEGIYRTFDWYKAGKSQAKTGFIVSSYLIASSLIGLTMTGLKESTFQVAGVTFDYVLHSTYFLLGIYWMYLRSGKSGKNTKNQKIVLPWVKK